MTNAVSTNCSVHELKDVLTDGCPASFVVIDVRSKGEFKGSNIEGVKNIPLDQIDKNVKDLKNLEKVYVHCHNGMRTKEAVKKLKLKGVNAIQVDGGIVEWKKAGYPVNAGSGGAISVMRQVQITTGTLILLGYILSLTINPNLILISVVMGAGLLFTGLSGSCAMAMMLEKLPWNK